MTSLYYPLVFGWCRKVGLQTHDAVEVAQEVFQAVWTGIDRFHYENPDDSFRGWLRGITRHKLHDFWRTAAGPTAKGGSSAQDLLELLPDQGDDSPAVRAETVMLARRALDLVKTEFEERTLQAFVKLVLEDRAPAEVAAELGLSLNAVYKAKYRVLRRLREELGETP
jgi:RNA polymerase sigma-70 factor (ECF subfamily)